MQSYNLTNQSIDQISESIVGFLEGKGGLSSKDITGIRLLYEEALLHYEDVLDQDTVVKLDCGERLNQSRVVLTVEGPRINPYESASEFVDHIVGNIGNRPNWSYHNGRNTLIYIAKKKPHISSAMQLVLAIILAIIFGLISLKLPENIRFVIKDGIVAPIFDTFMGFLIAVSGPLVFLSVLWGIYGIGDVATFGKIGKKLIGKCLLMTALLLGVAVVVSIPFINFSQAEGGSSDYSALFALILDIIPHNLFTPFTEGNPLQIIFIAVVFGIGMLFMGNKTPTVAGFIEESNNLVLIVMETVNKLIPIFVFLSVFNVIMEGNFSAFLNSYKTVIYYVGGSVFVIVFFMIYTSLRYKISPKLIISKAKDTFLLAASTTSSMAALPADMEDCEKKYGIDKNLVNMGVPLGHVIFMPASAISFFGIAVTMGAIYGSEITPQWVITAFILALILATAAPPVPGAAITCYSMIMTQMGISTEALAICIALNIVFDFCTTCTDIFALQMQMIDVAGSLDMLDKEKLHAPVKKAE